jgi:hypothetical protein
MLADTFTVNVGSYATRLEHDVKVTEHSKHRRKTRHLHVMRDD